MKSKKLGLLIGGILLLAFSFGIWSFVCLGLAWAIGFVFKLYVSYMTVFMVSSIAWFLTIGLKASFAYLSKKAVDNFME